MEPTATLARRGPSCRRCRKRRSLEATAFALPSIVQLPVRARASFPSLEAQQRHVAVPIQPCEQLRVCPAEPCRSLAFDVLGAVVEGVVAVPHVEARAVADIRDEVVRRVVEGATQVVVEGAALLRVEVQLAARCTAFEAVGGEEEPQQCRRVDSTSRQQRALLAGRAGLAPTGVELDPDLSQAVNVVSPEPRADWPNGQEPEATTGPLSLVPRVSLLVSMLSRVLPRQDAHVGPRFVEKMMTSFLNHRRAGPSEKL